MSDQKVCWVTFDNMKYDFSPAKEYGEPKIIFPSTMDRDYSPARAIDHARTLLGSQMCEDDYIIMAGDPTLYAIAVTVAVEQFGYCNVLRWNKRSNTYEPMELNFLIDED